MKNFDRMHGGEIFVPKIPSVRIVDLAKAMAPDLTQKVIGIRPEKKLHECMCRVMIRTSRLNLMIIFVIKPTVQHHSHQYDYLINNIGEEGKLVEEGFAYTSDKNTDF